MKRIVGRITGKDAGPSLIAMTGLHGNEPAGINAAQRVLLELERRRRFVSGEVMFIAGNLAALRENTRFIDLDLNRQWTPGKLEELAHDRSGSGSPAEHAEQRELLVTLREVQQSARGPIHFLDLHTSSADGPPFVTVGDTLRNRRFARRFPLPLILGLEEQVDGALLELLNNRGFVTMGVEAGRHESTEAVDRHEAVLWLALVFAGVLPAEQVPGIESYRRLLRQASSDVPPVVEVRHRHPVHGGDGFRMKPGFRNLSPISKGQHVADEASGPIVSPESGLMLLPLYQGQGEDGFFISREVRPFWLYFSAVLRYLRLNALMRFLPGVRLDPDCPEVLIVNTRVARLYPLEIFHLLGFRKVRQTGSELKVSRRRYDLAAPREIVFP